MEAIQGSLQRRFNVHSTRTFTFRTWSNANVVYTSNGPKDLRFLPVLRVRSTMVVPCFDRIIIV